MLTLHSLSLYNIIIVASLLHNLSLNHYALPPKLGQVEMTSSKPLAFLALPILGIVKAWIETRRIFSLASILQTLGDVVCRQIIKKDSYVNKNWPNDPSVGSFPTNLVELIEVDVEELEESFDRDEILNM